MFDRKKQGWGEKLTFAGTHCNNVSVGVHHVELTYDPIHFNAVTCSGCHIFVSDIVTI